MGQFISYLALINFFFFFNKKKLYLLRSIQNVNKTAATFFFLLQLQSGIQLTEQQLFV